MIRRNLQIISVLTLSALLGGCAGSTTSQNASTNANTATVVTAGNSNAMPVNANIAVSSETKTNSAIPGIPNASANTQISKEDPTQNAKVQKVMRIAPDSSEIETTLGENIVETRTFKNNAQIAKIEKIKDAKTQAITVKVYLRNGKVHELPEGKVGDPMAESAANIMKALSGEAKPPAETKPKTAESETTDGQKKP